MNKFELIRKYLGLIDFVNDITDSEIPGKNPLKICL